MKQLQEDLREVKAFLKKKIYTEEFAKEFLVKPDLYLLFFTPFL